MRQYIQYIFLVLSFGSVSDFLEMSKFAWILLVIAFDPTGQNVISVQVFYQSHVLPPIGKVQGCPCFGRDKKISDSYPYN